MNYDDWKTEAPEDYAWRMGRGDRREDEPTHATSGVCACGKETTTSVSQRRGFIWQCPACREQALRAIYDRASRKVG